MQSELEPCPNVLCGDKNAFAAKQFRGRLWYVMCRTCGAGTPKYSYTEAEAITAWNTRAERPEGLQRWHRAGGMML